MKKIQNMKAKCYIKQLPTELKLQIMSYLPGIDLARLACVSCEWQRLTPSSDSEVWKNLCHADKGWMLSTKWLMSNHRNYGNNFGWNWKDMFGLWTLCGFQYFIWLLMHDCAEQGLHYAIKLFKKASKIPPIELQPYYDIYPSGFMDQDPELPFSQFEWGLYHDRGYFAGGYRYLVNLGSPYHQAGHLYQPDTDTKSVGVDEAPPGMQQQE